MAKKIFKFKGKTFEELKEMSINELALLFNSRVRRSIKRGFTEAKQKFLKKTEVKSVVKTHFRDVPILPHMVGKTIKVYNGKDFVDIIVTQDMIGHLLGEFSSTRKRAGHTSPGVSKKGKPVRK